MEDDDEGCVVMIDHTGAHELEPLGGRWFKGRKVVITRKSKAQAKKRESSMKLFYVGSKDIARNYAQGNGSDWPIGTEDEAITKARNLCIDTGQPQIVVKIVAVIEPAARPVTVRRVR